MPKPSSHLYQNARSNVCGRLLRQGMDAISPVGKNHRTESIRQIIVPLFFCDLLACILSPRLAPSRAAPTKGTAMKPIFCSRKEGSKLLGVGLTTLDALTANGVIESVKIRNRRLLKIASIHRLAGIDADPRGEA